MVEPFAITGTAAENLHWISYATASASWNLARCPASPLENGPKLSPIEAARRHVAVEQI